MKKFGVFILGETDYVAYQHTFKEAKELAAHGATYIAQNLEKPSDPVSIVGLMLDADWMSSANDEQKGAMGGIISGIFWDTGAFARVPLSATHSIPREVRQAENARAGYRYFLRITGVVEWKELGLMWIETIYKLRLAPH